MKRVWWKESIVYQIYPRSFKDTNGDGVGDIKGIIEKLDHIRSLGVDVIWICPVYDSPNDDNGYDIKNYFQILSEFGSMSDFDELLEKVHQSGMKLIMDLVANHTSDEHAWFLESRASTTSDKRDYYIWKDGKNGNPPNNWKSFFGGDAWEYDSETDQYYLHLFTRKQPDLNWENPRLRQDLYQMMHWWLQKGIDGFRMDVISLISKRNYEDTPFSSLNETIENVYANGPKVHAFIHEMNREVLSKYDIMTVGEGPGITLEQGLDYVQYSREELNMIFHFGHMFMDHGPGGKFDPVPYDFVEFKKVFIQWDEAMQNGGWSAIFLGNHDFPRIVSRFGNDTHYREASAKALCLMLHTLRGTPYIYQGEEIGMTNVAFESIDEYRDVETLNAYQEVKTKGGVLEQMIKAIHWQGRDNTRTPMQWDASTNAGFTTGKPWIKVNPNYKAINVEAQEKDSGSILNFYREVIQIRKKYFSLTYGDFFVIDPEHARVFAYWRSMENECFLVLINFSDGPVEFRIDDRFSSFKPTLIKSNYDQPEPIIDLVAPLKPWEASLYAI
jgi:oligo-1,6-glucosidase